MSAADDAGASNSPFFPSPMEAGATDPPPSETPPDCEADSDCKDGAGGNCRSGSCQYDNVDASLPASCSIADSEVLDRSDWSVRASRYAYYTDWAVVDPPEFAIDGLTATRYTSGSSKYLVPYGEFDGGAQPACLTDSDPSPLCGGQVVTTDDYFLVDLGEDPPPYNQLVTDSLDSPVDFPARYAIDVSDDGNEFVQLAEVDGAPLVTVCFDTQTARYLRLRPTLVVNNKWWSIHELNLWYRD